MPVTTFQGTIENGQVRLPANANLPEKATVYVVVLERNASDQKFDLAEMLSRMPPDYQVNEEGFGSALGKEEW